MYQETQYKVAIYLRISKDDGDNVESESITNQRKIIQDYLKRNDNFIFYKEYIDDGFSGANFNRPAFKEMLKDIDNKKVNAVITKNLARFGRNYIESGEYLQKIFPDKGVRYIAVLDNYDNFLETVESEFLPLISVFNEKHCKDTSISVKKSKRKRMTEGVYACTTPPYGYKKDPNNSCHLIVDEVSSKIVKKIFELKIKGLTLKEIAIYLNKKKITTPILYSQMKYNNKIENADIWKSNMICRILGNQVYLGKCIRGKTQKLSYKTNKKIHIPHEEYIIVENTHEPIVTQEMFDAVHPTKKYHNHIKKKENNYLLKNVLYCSECGKRMYIKERRNKLIAYCSQNEKSESLCLNKRNINYNLLEEQVINKIKQISKEYLDINSLDELVSKSYTEKINTYIYRKKVVEKDIKNITQKIYNLYNDKLNGRNEHLYKEQYSKLNIDRNNKKEELEKKEEEIKKLKTEQESKLKIEDIKQQITKIINEEICIFDIENLIEKVEISAKTVLVKFRFTNGYKRFFMP